MNIAFYTYNKCIPCIGGTERTTALVVEELIKQFHYNVFSIYRNEIDLSEKMPNFSGIFRFENPSSEALLCDFIKKNKITIIINQGDFNFGEILGKIIKHNKLYCKQIFALHFAPAAYEKANISFTEKIRQAKINPRPDSILKVVVFPLYHYLANQIYKHQYRNIIKWSYKIILLSNKYTPEWLSYAYGKVVSPELLSKFKSIPNALTFPEQSVALKEKKKRILIVTRLDERQKRISKALALWKDIAILPEAKDWELDIVGEGSDRDKYEEMVEKYNIQRVHFYGRQNPLLFYQRASIFLMTSEFEGWPLTLVEALQFGVVPVVFDTFSAVHDIIKDNYNGYLIQRNDFHQFQEKSMRLISDNNLRYKMAVNGIRSIKKFDPITIATEWNNLLLQTNKASVTGDN